MNGTTAQKGFESNELQRSDFARCPANCCDNTGLKKPQSQRSHHQNPNQYPACPSRGSVSRSGLPAQPRNGGQAERGDPMSEVWGHTASELINRELPKTSLPRMREYVGEHITWMLLDGHHDSEIVASMRKSVVDCCEVPSAISEADIKKQVRMIREKLEAAGRIQPIRPNEDRSGLSPYIVPRKDSNTAGMFPRGKVSLIA